MKAIHTTATQPERTYYAEFTSAEAPNFIASTLMLEIALTKSDLENIHTATGIDWQPYEQ